MTKSSWKLLINEQAITLTTIKRSGTCFKCHNYKVIRLVSERKHSVNGWELRKFCGDCSLHNLYQLEDKEIANKTQIIKELRTELNNYE